MKARKIVLGGVIAALYVALTYAQNFIWPGSATMAIQLRLSEALCVLAFFTPAAIPGLTLGCLIFNVSFAQALPLDWVVGSLATLLATLMMWKLRFVQFKRLPVLGLLMPAIFNAPLVGWELTVYLGDTGFTLAAFALNALFVFLGEAIVLLVLGPVVYFAIKSRRIDELLAK